MPSSILTKKIFAQALKKRMLSKSFAKISIGDITAECGMNRNSFYYHFQDKYELLNWIFLTELTEEISTEAFLDLSNRELIQKVSTFFYTNREFYKNAMEYDGQNSFIEYLKETLYTLLEDRIEDAAWANDDPELNAFFLNFFMDGLICAILRLVRNEAAYPPDRFAELLQKSLTGIAARILEE